MNKIIIPIILIIILGVIGTLYAKVWDPLWSPFRTEPLKVIEEMQNKMLSLKTLHSETDFSIDIKNEKEFSLTETILTDQNNRDLKNPKSVSDLSLTITTNGMSLNFKGLYKTIGKTFYLKLTKIPALSFIEPQLEMFGINISEFKDQWIKLDQESFINWLKAYVEKMAGQELISQFEESISKQEELMDKLKEIFEGKKLYSLKKELPDEIIDGKKVYHYLTILNREEIKKMLSDLILMIDGYIPRAQKIEEPEKKIKEFEESFDEFFDKLGDIEIELLIDKKDLLLYQSKIEKEIDLSKFKEGEEGKVNIKFNMKFSEFNKSVEIKAPEISKPIEEILENIILKLFEYQRQQQMRQYQRAWEYQQQQQQQLMEEYRKMQEK